MANVKLVVAAGGEGMRLYPLSHPDCPKQFCLADSQETFIEKTVKRFLPFLNDPAEVIVIVTSLKQQQLAYQCLKKLGVLLHNILIFPKVYDYAGCMVRAAQLIAAKDPEAIIINTPADQLIGDQKQFAKVLKSALAQARLGQAVGLGIDITDASAAKGLGHYNTRLVGKYRQVIGFIEKPTTEELAKAIIENPQTAGNTGINLWPAHLVAELPLDVNRGIQTDQLMTALMETGNLWAVFGSFEWYDCGTLSALWTVNRKSSSNNVYLSKGIYYRSDCYNSLFIAPESWQLYVHGLRDVSVVVNIINDQPVIAIVNHRASQLVKELYVKLSQTDALDVQIEAHNNVVLPSDYAYKIGFVGVNNLGITVFDDHRGGVIVYLTNLQVKK